MSYIKRISVEKDLKKELLSISVPGRYSGGEYGSIVKEDAPFSVALCFPDLYEIGMSNQAVKILYSWMNALEHTACERVFSPAPDFESVLRSKNIPLYTLETGRPVGGCDILAFTIGYELCATNILNVLELAEIPLRCEDRTESDPVVIAGGPAITNPHPFGRFLDAVFIGEAEASFIQTLKQAESAKIKGAGRQEILGIIRSNRAVWYPGKTEKTVRDYWEGFGEIQTEPSCLVPSISAVQDHGVVEIMRGCPNGCRFCHAGIYYRPMRQKSFKAIVSEIDSIISGSGYNEITLSSLSSGDYGDIRELYSLLNNRYSKRKISFSFPSMRVNSFTLPLISELSKVRKSGLTFAVETPDPADQNSLNKEVTVERTIEILNEARKMGWNKAKFYFMIGLPIASPDDEDSRIIDFLREIGRESRMQLNVNIGTFIPKAHTPYQWSFQLDEKTSAERINKIKMALPPRFFKVGYQSPFMSYLEGVLSRGGDSTADLIESAFKKGARLDAWEEYINKDAWRETFRSASYDVEENTCRQRDVSESLPWDDISLRVSKDFLIRELDKSIRSERTEACSESCDHPCGSCGGDKGGVRKSSSEALEEIIPSVSSGSAELRKILFSFTKEGKSIFISHINVMNVFERSFLRAGVDINYTEGFNPKPRLEFAHPISLGIVSADEMAAVEIFSESFDAASFIQSMNEALPEGIRVTRAEEIVRIVEQKTGKKSKSLMSVYGGSTYRLSSYEKESCKLLTEKLEESGIPFVAADCAAADYVVVHGEKHPEGFNPVRFIKEKLELDNPFLVFEMERLKTFATGAEDYFSLYAAEADRDK